MNISKILVVSCLVLAACGAEPPIEYCETAAGGDTLVPLEELDYVAHAGGSPYGLNQLPQLHEQ